MVAALLGDDAEPAVRRARASATSRSSAACWSCTASGSPTAPSTASWSSTRPTWSGPTSTRSTCTPAPAGSRSCSAARCCTGSATRSSPTWAAATSAAAPDRLPPAGAARVRRGRRQDARRAWTSPRRTACTAPSSSCRTRASAPPSRCCSPPCCAEGVTELRNAAVEPEIIDLICVLQKMGAIIKVHTDRVIEIEGVDRLGGYTPPADPGPHRGGELGRGGAGHRRRRRTCAAPGRPT